jgi:hypothetical protein
MIEKWVNRALMSIGVFLFASCSPSGNQEKVNSGTQEPNSARYRLHSARVDGGGSSGGQGMDRVFLIDSHNGRVWVYCEDGVHAPWETNTDSIRGFWLETENNSLADPLGLFDDRRDSIYHAMNDSSYMVGKYKVSVRKKSR